MTAVLGILSDDLFPLTLAVPETGYSAADTHWRYDTQTLI